MPFLTSFCFVFGFVNHFVEFALCFVLRDFVSGSYSEPSRRAFECVSFSLVFVHDGSDGSDGSDKIYFLLCPGLVAYTF